MAVLGFRFCARASSSCGKRGPLFIAVRGPLTIAASPVAEHRLQTRRLSNCGSQAQLLRGMWDLPRPGLEPVSPALASRLSTTAPPGKPKNSLFKMLHKEDFSHSPLGKDVNNGLGPGLASSFTLILKTTVNGVGRIIFTLELGRSCQLIILLFRRGAMIHTQVCVPPSHYTGDFLSNVY